MANTQRRMIYSKIWTSEQVGKLSDKAKLLFIGTITLADDDGRLRGNPAYLRGQIFPYEENLTVTEVLQFRNEIEKNGLIQVYSNEDCEYIQHPKWLEYQIIRKDLYKESSLPSRNETVTSLLRKRTLSKDKISKDKIGVRKVLTNGGVQEVNEYKVADLWKMNVDFYEDKGVAPETPPIRKGVARFSQRGSTDKAKGIAHGATKEEPILNKNPLKKNTIPFEDFYSIYPKKLAKKEAEKAWGKLSSEDAEKALADVPIRRAKHSQWLRDDGKYIPYPASYLNGERWNDEIITEKTGKQPAEVGKYDNIKQITIKQ